MERRRAGADDPYRKSRLMFILEAALEYFIDIMVGDAYLATVTKYLGFSTALTGILSSIISLACVFQLASLPLVSKRPVKRWVVPTNLVCNTFFAMLFLIPLLPLSQTLRTVLAVGCLLLGHSIHKIVYAPTTEWCMSVISDSERGIFTANKEIVSLIGGMVFSLIMSRLIDSFRDSGRVETAFLIIALVIIGLMLMHAATLLNAKERPGPVPKREPILVKVRELLRDRVFLRVLAVNLLWFVAYYGSAPFYGAYKVGELGFSMTFVSLLSIGYSIIRSLVSRPIGRFADKHSFARMLIFCYGAEGLGMLANAFCTPANGHVVFTVYYLLSAVAMAGINSGLVNLLYDLMPKSLRVEALAVKNAVCGVAGFLSTLLFSMLVDRIQNNGNTLFGIHVYAQQVLSFIAFLLMGVLILYIVKAVLPLGKTKDSDGQ